MAGIKISYAQTATGVISYTKTITLETDKTHVDVTWPDGFQFSNVEYFLYVRAWYEDVIDDGTAEGKTIQVENGIYNFNKSVSGFSLDLKTSATNGKLTYYAVEASQAPISSTSYEQSFIATQGQTRFTLDNTPAETWVWLNGLLQFPGVYSTEDNDIILVSAANEGDQLGVYYKEGESNGGGTDPDPTQYTITVSEKYQNQADATNTGEVENESGTYADGATVNLATDFPHIGINFLGYTVNIDGTNPSTSLNITITQDVTVYAVFNYTEQSSSTLSDGLVAYYGMEEESGTIMGDDLNNAPDGTIHGATVNQTGHQGKAYTFDGIDDYIEIPDNTAFDLTSNFTISFWFKVGDVSQTQTIFGKIANASSHEDPYFLYSTEATPASGEFVQITSRITVGGTDATKTHYNQSTGVWHHLIYTFEGHNMRIYLDGAHVSKYHPGNVDTNNLPIRIGANGALSNFLQGQVDEFGVWNRVLSEDERNELYSSGTGKAYPFDGSSTPTNYTLTVTEKYLNNAAENNPGSVSPDSQEYTEGTTVTVANDFTNDGAHFSEYFCWNEDGSNPVTEFVITQDTTIYAVYDYTEQAASTLLDSLVSCWEFEETSGTVAEDIHGDNNGTTNDATILQTGKISKAYLYNGSDSYIEVDNSTSLNLGGDKLTLSAWVKLNTVSGYRMIASKPYASTSHASPWFSYTLHANGNKLRMVISTNVSSNQSINSVNTLTTGMWYHVVGVYDGSEMKLYINGIKDSATKSITGNLNQYNTPLRIGTNGGFSEDFDGLIDQIGIWNRALTDQEITELYNSGSGNTYPFDGSSTPTNYTLTVTEKYLNDAADNNPGSIDNDSQDYAEGTVVALTNDFPNEGDHFEGYTINSEGTNPDMSLNITITEDVTVYAVYDYSSQSSSTLLNGLIAAYEFEETTGTSLIDSTSNGLNGINNGATINQSGKLGKAYNFNNIESDYVQLPNTSFDFEYNNAFSISVWFKPTSSKTQGLFFKSQESGDYRGYGVWLEDNENVTCRIRHNSSNYIYRRSNSSIVLNEWNHVLFMYDGSTNSSGANLYINGIKETSWYADVSTLGSVTIKNSINTNIGARNDGNSMQFSGLIDQTSIWNRELTQQEITELYNSGNGKAYPFE